MICTCVGCRRPFWRYRRDYPPPGYCSVPCHDMALEHPEVEDPPAPPHVLVQRLKQHMMIMHDSLSMLIWPDCDTCEELQAEYARSLAYHYDRLNAQIEPLRRCRRRRAKQGTAIAGGGAIHA